jgi:hypothetical protein
LLDEVIAYSGRASIGAHAILGQFVPQLHLIAPEWVERNAEVLFAGGAEEPLSKPAWGAYITRARLYDSVFREIRPWYLRAAQIAGTDSGWKAQEGDRWSLTDHLAQHALIACVRGLAAVGDEDRFIETVFTNVPVRDRGHACWTIFRGWSDSMQAPSSEYVQRLIGFWDWRLSTLEGASEAQDTVEEAKGLGWFMRTPFLPDEAVVRLGLRTTRLARGNVELYTEWERLRELAHVDLEGVFGIAELTLSAQIRAAHPYVPVEEVMPFLEQILQCNQESVSNRATTLIHRLGEHGYAQFGKLLELGSTHTEAQPDL